MDQKQEQQSENLDRNHDTFSITKQLLKLKTYMFRIFLEVGQCTIVSMTLLKIFIFIETLQFLYYSIHDSYKVSDSSVLDGFRNVIQYLQINSIIYKGNSGINNLLLYTVFLITFFLLIIIVSLILKLHKMEANKEKILPNVYQVLIKILCLFSNLLSTVLIIPFVNIFMVTLICDDNSPANKEITCYSGQHVINFTLAIIGIFILLLLIFIISTFLINLNPFSIVPFSGPASNILLVKGLLKVIILFYQTIDYDGNLWIYFVIFLTIYYTFILIKRYQIISYYNQSLTVYVMRMECIVLWVTFCITMQGLADEKNTISNKELLYVFIFIPLVIGIWSAIISYRNEMYLQQEVYELKKPEEVEKQIIILIALIENFSNIESQIYLEGYIRLHAISCNKQNCMCVKITDTAVQRELQRAERDRIQNEQRSVLFEEFKKLNNNLNGQELEQAFAESQQDKNQMNSTHQNTQRDQQQEQEDEEDHNEAQTSRNWYLFLSSQIQEAQEILKSPKIYILDAFIQFFRLRNTFFSLKQLMTTESLKPKIYEQFAILQSRDAIEQSIISENMLNEKSKVINVNITVDYENQFVFFMKKVSASLEFHNDFWSELLDKNPDVQKLQILGMQITSSLELVDNQFQILLEMNERSIRSVYNYAFFVKDVANDEDQFLKYLEKMEYIMKSNQNNIQQEEGQQKLFGENSKCAIIQVSANLANRYAVTNINHDVTRIFQFSKKELLGQNIKNRIMPRAYSQIHNRIIDNYMNTSRPTILGYEALVFPVNKQGYMVPSKMLVRVLPNLDDGMQFVSFVKNIDDIYMHPYLPEQGSQIQEDETVHYMVYKSGLFMNIVGITRSIQEQFGIHQDLTNDNTTMAKEFTLDLICPQVTDKMVQQQMFSEKGAIITIDTFIIKQQYLVSKNVEKDPNSDEKKNAHQIAQKQNKLDEEEDEDDDEEDDAQEKKFEEKQHLLIDENEENDVEKGNEQDEEELQRDDQNIDMNYRKSKIKIQIIQQFSRFGLILNVAKFVEILEEEDDDQQNIKHQKKMSQQQYNNYNAEIDINDEELGGGQQDLNPIENEENNNLKTEVQQLGSQEDLEDKATKSLRDMRALIQEKSIPKSIKFLERIMCLLFVFILSIITIILTMKISQIQSMFEGLGILQVAYDRHSVMANINVGVFRLNALANFYNTTFPYLSQGMDDYSTYLRDELAKDIQIFQGVHYDVISKTITANKQLDQQAEPPDVQVQDLLSNNQFVKHTLTLNQGIEKFISSAAALTKYDEVLMFSDIQNTDVYASDSAIYQYFVRENGLFSLRIGSERLAEEMYNLYMNVFNLYESQLFTLIISTCCVIALSQSCFLPIVFKVYRANTNVITLFSLIPIEQIQELVSKVDFYNNNFILKHNEGNQESASSYEEDQVNIQQQQQNMQNQQQQHQQEQQTNYQKQKKHSNTNNNPQEIKNKLIATENDESNNVQDNHDNEEENQNIIESNQKSAEQKVEEKEQKGTKKKKKKKKQNELINMEEDELAQLRSEKLMATVQNKRKFIVLQFFMFSLLFIAYFLFDFYYEKSLLSKAILVYEHMRYINIRSSIVKFRILATNEFIMTDEDRLQVIIEKYQQEIYDNDKAIDKNFLEAYPGAFDTYKEKFISINANNLCQNAFEHFSKEEREMCLNVDNEILKQGLKQSVTALTEQARDVVIKYKVERNKTYNIEYYFKETKKALLNGRLITNLLSMIDYIVDANDELRLSLIKATEEYSNSQQTIEQVKFGCIIAVIFLGFIFIWLPYLNQLNKKIWMTKGILSMIPQKTILKNRTLLDSFMKGDIIKAVR